MTRWSSAAIALALISTAAAGEATRRTYEHPCMGTLFRVVIYSDQPEASTTKAAKDAFRIADCLNETLSDYAGDTNMVGKFNYSPPGVPQAVSEQLLDVLDRARELSIATGGRFDPTAGALSWRWRLARRTGKLPDKATLALAKSSVGFAQLKIDREAMTIARIHPMTRLDFGAIGKGYAADQMLAHLRSRGFPSASIAAGGDVRVGDPPPGREAWNIEIRPRGDSTHAPQTVQLSNAAVSTSGDVEQAIEIEGVRYAHILNPETGLGLTRPAAACVIAPTATESDALATALAIGQTEIIRSIASRKGCHAALFQDPASPDPTLTSPDFKNFLIPASPVSR